MCRRTRLQIFASPHGLADRPSIAAEDHGVNSRTIRRRKVTTNKLGLPKQQISELGIIDDPHLPPGFKNGL